MKDEYGNYVRLEDAGIGDWQKIAYENFANAIVESACDEYVNCIVRAKGNILPKDPTIQALIRFFNSQWYHELTNIDTDYLIRKLNSKAQDIIKANQTD